MPALAYENLGGISGVIEGNQAPYSKRGRDRDRHQTFIFECDSTNPFTGTVFLQISQDSPPLSTSRVSTVSSGADLIWSDVAKLEFVAESEIIFLEIEVEATQIRMVCPTYVGGKILNIKTMR